MIVRTLNLTGIIAILLMLGGCAVNRLFIPEVHKVHPGESLTSIAAEYDLNWHNLARWNNIKPPYTIQVGQRLSLDPFPPLNYAHMGEQQYEPPVRSNRPQPTESRHPSPRSTVTAMPANPAPQVNAVSVQETGKWQLEGSRGPANRAEVTTPDKTASTVTASTGLQSPDTRTTAQSQQASGQSLPQPPPLVSPEGWRWPLAASVLADHDSQPFRHGVNLAGILGTPVYAARDGTVVYSGIGLQGFGQLVIIDHGDSYLSAYGYLQHVQVEEGDKITTGQHIADMGLGPGSKPLLHFEIRRNGKPLEPTSVLPEL